MQLMRVQYLNQRDRYFIDGLRVSFAHYEAINARALREGRLSCLSTERRGNTWRHYANC
jgi:hypothetical protein